MGERESEREGWVFRQPQKTRAQEPTNTFKTSVVEPRIQVEFPSSVGVRRTLWRVLFSLCSRFRLILLLFLVFALLWFCWFYRVLNLTEKQLCSDMLLDFFFFLFPVVHLTSLLEFTPGCFVRQYLAFYIEVQKRTQHQCITTMA